MKRVFVCLFLLFFMNTIHVFSQENDSLEQLKHQIRELEKLDRDENVSFDVKQINATFLDDRRATLRKTLETRIESAQQYLFRVGSQLSNAEIQVVEQNIAAWRKELALQTEGSPAPRAAVATQPLSQPAVMRPETSLNVVPASAPAPPPPQSQNKPLQSAPVALSPAGAALIRQPVAEIINPTYADQLIDAAFNANAFKDANDNPIPRPAEIDRNDFHCVIHVLRWSDPDAANKQTVVAQNWYVYNNGKAKGLRSDRIWSQEDFTGDRIYGVKKIWLLYVHLNTKVGYNAYYDFQFTKKTPANISNLLALAQVFTIIPGGAAAAPSPPNVWGGSFVETDYVPSDATITANISPTPGTYVALDKPKKFDNEGLYWWDVSIGVPIRKIKELQFDSTANTITAKEVDQQNAFALLNLYFPPKDIKGTTSSWIPHFIGGVAIAKQPLKKFMFGAGFGPNFTNFYVGALFTEQKRPATLTEGSTATPDQLNNDLRRHFKAQFTFGINIPVRAVLATLEKKKE